MTFVIICLDGFKFDYLKKTKFLKKIAEDGTYGELHHGFGFASEYSAITGKETEELEIIANFYYNPNNVKLFYWFRFLDNLPAKNLTRFFLGLVYNTKEFLVGNNQPKSVFNIPLKKSRYFDYVLKKNIFEKDSLKFPTIFDVFRKKKKVSGYMWPFILENKKIKIDIQNFASSTANTDERAFKKAIQLLKKNPEVCYVHFFSTDNLVHKYGTESKKTEGLIKTLDKYVSEINNYASKILIFSDHGMTNVKDTIDIQKIINKSGLVSEKDYIMFLDSTLARFWPLNKDAKDKIKVLLEQTNKGKFIFFKNKKIHRRFGDLIFQINPGILILPNFYQTNADKAMHGYDEKTKDEKGIYILHDKFQTKKKELRKDLKINQIFDIIINNIQ